METKEQLFELSKVFFPLEVAENFEIAELNYFKDYIVIRFNELPESVPAELSGVDGIIRDGFLNPIELQSFPAKGKPVYLKVYRRRWKVQGEQKSYWNNYDLKPEGIKATRRFAYFVKKLLKSFTSGITLISKATLVDRKKLWRWKKVMIEEPVDSGLKKI